MPIENTNQYIAAPKQVVQHWKSAARTTIALGWFTLFDLAGSPGAGTLAAGNTANGIVPVAGQPGYPIISPFGVGNHGHISRIRFANTVTGQAVLGDQLFKAGAYAFNADVTLASQPTYDARVATFVDLEIWVEAVTAATGNLAVNVFYTNQAGVTGRQTGATGIGAAPTVGRCWQLPLQSGDSGVQRIERVVGSVATAGTFNVMVYRPLWEADTVIAGIGTEWRDLLGTGLTRTWEASALYSLIAPLGTSSGMPKFRVEISNG